MPRGDGTGPFGQGPMSGRGPGYCRGVGRSNEGSAGGGGNGPGFGGRGLGARLRNRFRKSFIPTWSRLGSSSNECDGISNLDREELKGLARELEQTMKLINERLDVLEASERPKVG